MVMWVLDRKESVEYGNRGLNHNAMFAADITIDCQGETHAGRNLILMLSTGGKKWLKYNVLFVKNI